jgi:hypothetical protein
VDFAGAGVSETDWKAATAGCFELRVRRVIDETSDARSIGRDPPQLRACHRQSSSPQIPWRAVLTRSYSLAALRLRRA